MYLPETESDILYSLNPCAQSGRVAGLGEVNLQDISRIYLQNVEAGS